MKKFSATKEFNFWSKYTGINHKWWLFIRKKNCTHSLYPCFYQNRTNRARENSIASP